MDKEQLIALIEGQLATGKLSKEDLIKIAGIDMNALTRQMPVQTTPLTADIAPVKEDASKGLIHTLYAIGAIIAVVGVGILTAQFWDDIGFGGRIVVTLGISLVSYITAMILRASEQNMISQILFTVSAALAPVGVYVFLSEANITFDLPVQIMTALVLFIIYGCALVISKKNILVLISIAFASWAYYAFVLNVFDVDYYSDADFLKWATILIGVSYMAISYGYKAIAPALDAQDAKEKKAVQNILYGLGTLGILGAGITIGGIFDLFFIALIFAAFYGSVYLKSRSMLTFGALFLMAHIIKLTSEYFVDSIGWPVALIFIGFLVIGIGYMTFYLNKKFISGSKA